MIYRAGLEQVLTIQPQDIERQLRDLQKRVEIIERKLEPINLHSRARQRMIEAIRKQRKFRSKRQWARYARVSMDTFYRLEKEVIRDLERQGYKTIYQPISSRKNSRVYSYEVRLE